jgi:hypothetical protein
MKKEDFSALLTDLYKAYNPEYLDLIPQLVEKYSRMEFSAVDMVLVKYNRKNASFYDSVKDTDEYKHMLIREYSNGNRPLKDFNVQDETQPKKEDMVAQEGRKIEESLNKKLDDIKSQLSEKEKALVKEYENKIKELSDQFSNIKPSKQSIWDDVDVKIFCNYTEKEIVLPNKELIIGLGVGARIVTATKDGSKVIGLKINDILYDGISSLDGKPVIEIIVDKE